MCKIPFGTLGLTLQCSVCSILCIINLELFPPRRQVPQLSPSTVPQRSKKPRHCQDRIRNRHVSLCAPDVVQASMTGGTPSMKLTGAPPSTPCCYMPCDAMLMCRCQGPMSDPMLGKSWYPLPVPSPTMPRGPTCHTPKRPPFL